MMKRVIQFAALGALTSVVAASTASAQAKLAYINSQKIMSQAPGRAEAEAEYDKERSQLSAQYQRMRDSLQALFAAYEKEAPKLDSATRATREESLRDKQEDFELRGRAMDSTLQKKQMDLAAPLMRQVSTVLDELRQKGGYSMIFDVASGNVVVSADTTLDISDQVLARLKELGPPKPLPTAPLPSGPVRQPTGVPPRTR